MSLHEANARLGELAGLLDVGWSGGVASMTNGEWYFFLNYDLLGDGYEWYIDDGTFDEFLEFVKEVMRSAEWN